MINPSSSRVGPFVRSLLGAVLFLGSGHLLWPAAAPANVEPVPKAIAFRMHISGFGGSPKSTINSGLARSEPEWTYERTVEGWFEVEVARRRSGVSAEDIKVIEAAMKAMPNAPSLPSLQAGVSELIDFRVKRGGRHRIVGSVLERAKNFERWIGEGFGPTIYADYTASEEAKWQGAVEPWDTLIITLDATKKVWLTMLEPKGWIDGKLSSADYHGEAFFEPSSPAAGFGKPWAYATNDPSRKLAGEERQIETGYDRNTMSSAAIVFPAAVMTNVPAKFDGTVATGKVEYKVPRPASVTGAWTMHYSVEWTARTELPDVELEVRCPDYLKWRPTATEGSAAPGSARTYGEGLAFSAELRRVDGDKSAPLPRIRQLEWRLSDTSREPGIAMNFPYKSDDRRLDMEIVAGDLTEPEDATAQAVVIKSPKDAINEAVVFPYDWGGWSTLRVTATLEDGRRIRGILSGGERGQLSSIRVPASAEGSKIAWRWMRDNYPQWQSDADDDDAIPAGKPGVSGDGFSAYEEYRGFYNVLRTHQSTSPKKKSLFVCTDKFTPGVFRFFETSGLERCLLGSEQLPRAGMNERVVNCNVGAGATCGPQTALYVVDVAGAPGPMSAPIPSGSRPKSVPRIESQVNIEQTIQDMALSGGIIGTAGGSTLAESLLVRSLFQAVGVDRPGPPGKIGRLKFVSAAEADDNKPHWLLGSSKIVLQYENGQDDLAAMNETYFSANKLRTAAEGKWTAPAFNVIVGLPGSSHSGPEYCVMRDWYADIYLSHYRNDGVPVYKWATGERPGTRLGTTRKGTGINDAKRPLGSRYGDSAVRPYPASQQLVVKDQAP